MLRNYLHNAPRIHDIFTRFDRQSGDDGLGVEGQVEEGGAEGLGAFLFTLLWHVLIWCVSGVYDSRRVVVYKGYAYTTVVLLFKNTGILSVLLAKNTVYFVTTPFPYTVEYKLATVGSF